VPTRSSAVATTRAFRSRAVSYTKRDRRHARCSHLRPDHCGTWPQIARLVRFINRVLEESAARQDSGLAPSLIFPASSVPTSVRSPEAASRNPPHVISRTGRIRRGLGSW